MWTEPRRVTKTATVSLWGNIYEVDAHLCGQTVELSFDPFDLAEVQVRWRGKDFGCAGVHSIRRHSHPKARPEPGQPDKPTTGIDYLRLAAANYEAQLKKRISYTDLPSNDQEGDAL